MAFYRRRRRRYSFGSRYRRFPSFRRRRYGGRGRFGGYRRPSFHYFGRGRRRGRARRAGREVRLVVQTPSDMLAWRPTAGAYARLKRRARF